MNSEIEKYIQEELTKELKEQIDYLMNDFDFETFNKNKAKKKVKSNVKIIEIKGKNTCNLCKGQIRGNKEFHIKCLPRYPEIEKFCFYCGQESEKTMHLNCFKEGYNKGAAYVYRHEWEFNNAIKELNIDVKNLKKVQDKLKSKLPRCIAILKYPKGKRCRRKILDNEDLCSQHERLAR